MSHGASLSVVVDPDLLDYLFRVVPASHGSIRRLKKCKTVCKIWCTVLRRVLTDCDWFLQPDFLIQPKTNNQLPLRCTLHPDIDSLNNTSDGLLTLNKPGNPGCSVIGTLQDLCVVKWSKGGQRYQIVHMVLDVDGIDGSFQTVWGALATKFRLTRAQVDGSWEWTMCEGRNELELITLGVMLQSKYWIEFDTVYNILPYLLRPNGLSCELTTHPNDPTG